MSNVLQFSLGLATGSFLSAAEKAGHAIKHLGAEALALPGLGTAVAGLIGGFTSLDAVVENIFRQFETGAGLAALSKQTGVGVKSLFELQKGFIAAHASAETVGPAIFQMQKALGGFSDMGVPTKDVFGGLGLAVADLKKADPAEAMRTILERIGTLAPDEAAKASSLIFGRQGGREMLLLARSTEEMAAGMARAAPQAELMAKNAGAFERIEVAMHLLKDRTQGLFIGLAEGVAPGLNSLLDSLNKIDLTGLGQRIGTAFAGIGEGIRQGHLGEILELSLKSGIRGAAIFLKAEFLNSLTPNLDPNLSRAAKVALNLGSGGMGTALGLWSNVLGTNAPEGQNPFSKELADKLAEWGKDAIRANQGEDVLKAAGKSLGFTGDEKDKSEKLAKQRNSDINSLERVGLVRFGGGATTDYTQQTAQHTRGMLDALRGVKTILEKINQDQSGDGFANLA